MSVEFVAGPLVGAVLCDPSSASTDVDPSLRGVPLAESTGAAGWVFPVFVVAGVFGVPVGSVAGVPVVPVVSGWLLVPVV
ncbi:MAG: hypothetical protein NVSMB16_13620 [Acidimicrobiales bacterium]